MKTMTMTTTRCVLFLLAITRFTQGFLLVRPTTTTVSKAKLESLTAILDRCALRRRATLTELYSSTSSTLKSSFSLLKKKNKRQRNRRKKGKTAVGETGGSISLDELSDHVSNEFIYGSGGILRDTDREDHDNHDDNRDNPKDNAETMRRNLNRHAVLVLNADYQPLSCLPLSLWNWQEAAKAVFTGKVTVVHVYPNVAIRAANFQVPLPSVIALTKYVSPPKMLYNKQAAFTRRNVFLRDEYRCQYCNDLFRSRDLSLDHVVPRCRGGPLRWDNVVTCCTGCNGKKGCLGLREIKSKWGMQLQTEPVVPTQYQLALTASRMLQQQPTQRRNVIQPCWEPYLPQFQHARHQHSNHPQSSSASSSSTTRRHHLDETEASD